MLYIPCVELEQFCTHYIQLPFKKKMANLLSKGVRGGGGGGFF